MFHDIAGHEELTERIIECGIRVHETFGPGLLESVYKVCLLRELEEAAIRVDASRRVGLAYRGFTLDCVYCPDIVVEDLIIVELKSVDAFHAVHTAQVLTYLKLTGLPIGLLLNFNVSQLRFGIRRVVHRICT